MVGEPGESAGVLEAVGDPLVERDPDLGLLPDGGGAVFADADARPGLAERHEQAAGSHSKRWW